MSATCKVPTLPPELNWTDLIKMSIAYGIETEKIESKEQFNPQTFDYLGQINTNKER